MDGDKVLEELRNIYQIVNGQIIFIESKNAGLVVFNVAIITIILNSPLIVNWGIKVIILGLLISCIIGFYSFAPNCYKCKRIKKIDYWNDSSIYFRNIAKYNSKDSKEYIKQLCRDLIVNDDIAEIGMANSYAKEIIILSQIIVIKDNAFRYAEITSIIFLIVFIFEIILKL